MKCKFCGARIKKSDELCPECGKLINSRESTADMGNCLKKFNCNDNIPLFLFVLIISIIMVIVGIGGISAAESIVGKDVYLVFAGIFLFLVSAYMCVIYYKSYICVCENGIYGVISQHGKPMPKFFELRYDEIKAVGMSITNHGKGGTTCIVAILTKNEEEYKIGYLNKKNSKLLSDMIHHRLDKQDTGCD